MRPTKALFLAIAMCAACAGPSFAQQAAPTQPASIPRQCFSTPETRERIIADRLAEPFALMRSAADSNRADAIGAKLCSSDGELVYEINLLRHDGRLIQRVFNAATGKPLSKRKER